MNSYYTVYGSSNQNPTRMDPDSFPAQFCLDDGMSGRCLPKRRLRLMRPSKNAAAADRKGASTYDVCEIWGFFRSLSPWLLSISHIYIFWGNPLSPTESKRHMYMAPERRKESESKRRRGPGLSDPRSPTMDSLANPDFDGSRQRREGREGGRHHYSHFCGGKRAFHRAMDSRD